MTVRTETATVYFGGRRRWFSLGAACRAEAKLRFKTDDESDESFDVLVPQLTAEARAEFDQSPASAPAAQESRALAACRAVVVAAAEVRRISKSIGEHLGACNGAAMGEDEIESRIHSGDFRTHLAAAYASEEVENDHGYGTHKEWLSESEKRAELAACPHCLAAHNAIQDRKQARKRLAAARRAITMIGKSK